jgi:peptide/nickel transport system permease protein
MFKPVLHRLLLSIPVLLIVSALTFVLTAITPGDPGRTLLGTTATGEAVEAFNESLGLNQPLYEQYWKWLEGVVHGDLGQSVFSSEPVTSILNSGLPVTLTLIIGATAISVLGGVLLGVLSALRGSEGNRLGDVIGTLGFAIPSFWLGLLLVILFALNLGWLPASGWVPFSVSPEEWALHSVLPVATLAIAGVAMIARQTRDGMLEELERPYVHALRARGLSERAIVFKHALRNALPNVVTLVGLYVVSLLLGTTLVEAVFAQQGLGSIAVQATSRHDLPVLQGVGIYFALIVIVVFCLTDVTRAWLNPKLRSR